MIAFAEKPDDDKDFKRFVLEAERRADIRATLVAGGFLLVGFALGIGIGWLIWG